MKIDLLFSALVVIATNLCLYENECRRDIKGDSSLMKLRNP